MRAFSHAAFYGLALVFMINLRMGVGVAGRPCIVEIAVRVASQIMIA